MCLFQKVHRNWWTKSEIFLLTMHLLASQNWNVNLSMIFFPWNCLAWKSSDEASIIEACRRVWANTTVQLRTGIHRKLYPCVLPAPPIEVISTMRRMMLLLNIIFFIDLIVFFFMVLQDHFSFDLADVDVFLSSSSSVTEDLNGCDIYLGPLFNYNFLSLALTSSL